MHIPSFLKNKSKNKVDSDQPELKNVGGNISRSKDKKLPHL